MLEDLTKPAEGEILKYVEELYAIERDYQMDGCDIRQSMFYEHMRKAVVKVEETCRYYLGNNYDISQYLFIAHEFRKKYFDKEEEPKEKSKNKKVKLKPSQIKARKRFKERFRKLMENE